MPKKEEPAESICDLFFPSFPRRKAGIGSVVLLEYSCKEGQQLWRGIAREVLIFLSRGMSFGNATPRRWRIL